MKRLANEHFPVLLRVPDLAGDADPEQVSEQFTVLQPSDRAGRCIERGVTQHDPISRIRAELDATNAALATTVAALSRAEEQLRLLETNRHATPGRDRPTHTLDEAAQALGVSRTTLWRLQTDDAIRIIEIGSRRVIARAELERFLSTGRPRERARPAAQPSLQRCLLRRPVARLRDDGTQPRDRQTGPHACSWPHQE